MTQSPSTTTNQQYVTNFNLLSLHLLYDEICVVLKDAELHLCQFYDDRKQSDFLLDSAEQLKQLSSVFRLIAFDGADVLAHALSLAYQKLHHLAQTRDDATEMLMMDVSEAVMLLERYVEFALLKAIPEATLMLAIINKIYAHLGKNSLSEQDLKKYSQSIIIYNPSASYVAPTALGIDLLPLAQAYRAGLDVVLSYQKYQRASSEDLQKLAGMTAACAAIAKQSDNVFWQAAAILTNNIVNDLPISYEKQRILIYIEQQFFNQLSILDRRFAQLFKFAFDKDEQFANQSKSALADHSLASVEQMQRFLLGPNHEMTSILNTLIQEQIEIIKQDVDSLVRGDGANIGRQVSTASISDALLNLSRTFFLLGLDKASRALQHAANQVDNWQTPTLEDLDMLLDKLMMAENAAIEMAKAHSFDTTKVALYNHDISLHRLDTAYEALIKEAKSNLATLASAINDYLADSSRDILNLNNTPDMMRQVAGAASFLRMTITARQLTRLAKQLDNGLLQKIHEATSEQLQKIINAWADVLISAQVAFDGFAKNQPSDRQALLVSEYSLNQLCMDE